MTGPVSEPRPGEPGEVTVRPAGSADRVAWAELAETCEGSTPYHLPAWTDAVSESLPHRAVPLVAETGGNVVGVLPLFLVSPPWGRAGLVSVPAANVGGAIGRDPAVVAALVAAARRALSDTGAQVLELRLERSRSQGTGLAIGGRTATYRVALGPDTDIQYRSLPKKIRAAIRKAKAGGVRVVRGRGDEDVRGFLDVYRAAMDRHGSPGFGEPFFRAIISRFGDRAEIFRGVRDGRTLSADLVIRGAGQVLPIYGGLDAKGREMGANYLVSWEEISAGCREGACFYDFGRSVPGTSAAAFKRRWGAAEVELVHAYEARSGPLPAPPDPHRFPYRIATAAWRWLPRPVRWWLGPRLVPYVH